MTVIEEAVEASAEVAGEAAALVIGPAAELAADVATLGVEAVVEGVEAAGELVDEVIEEGGHLLVKLLVLAGLVAIAVFVWKRLQESDEAPESDATSLS